MKTPFLSRALLLACALCVTGLGAVLADDSSSTPPPSPQGEHHGHYGGPQLTSDERAQLKKDRDAVFAANPDLKTEEGTLHQQMETLHQQMKDHMDKVDDAILKQDPSAAPIIAKLKAGHHGPPPDNGGNQ
jgi:Spy/CpxP family protein refolding chaperone